MISKGSRAISCRRYLHTFLTISVTVLSTVIVTSVAHAALRGDVAPRGCPDGQIDAADIAVIKKFVLGQLQPSSEDFRSRDIAPLGAPDGRFTAGDLAIVKKVALGLLEQNSAGSSAPPAMKFPKISSSFDGVRVTVTGAPCSVESTRTVQLTNLRTGQMVAISVGANSTFIGSISAQEGDQISIVAVDALGRSSPAQALAVLPNIQARGPYPVSWVELNDPNGLSLSSPETGFSSTLAWAKIMYPSTLENARGAPLANSSSKFPVVVFLHGHTSQNCLVNGQSVPYAGCPPANRARHHEGFQYVMEQLASRGIVSVSVSAVEINGHGGDTSTGPGGGNTRAKLILQHLDILRNWAGLGTDPFGKIFQGRLDMTKIGLSGHSQGARGVLGAQQLNRSWPQPHGIVAINPIAPATAGPGSFTDVQNEYGEPYYVKGVALMLLQGSHDFGASSGSLNFGHYDFAYPDNVLYPKVGAFIHGANHNHFNSTWGDDAIGVWTTEGRISAEEQRQLAIATIIPFFEWQLHGKTFYKNSLSGKHFESGIRNDRLFLSYQDPSRKIIDDFEHMSGVAMNKLGGAVTSNGIMELTACKGLGLCFPMIDTRRTSQPKCGGMHHHLMDGGLKMAWDGSAEYVTHLPSGHRDLRAYKHLAFRASKLATDYPAIDGAPVRIYLNVEDVSGNRAASHVRSDLFATIPHPAKKHLVSGDLWDKNPSYCSQINQSAFATVRIPLSEFARDGNVNLAEITKIIFRVEGADTIALDDIEATE